MRFTSLIRTIPWACAAMLVSGLIGGPAFGVATESTGGTVVLEPRRDEAVFAYRGRRGPDSWGELEATWSQCKQGTAQSPIDLTEGEGKKLPRPKFDYQSSPMRVLNNGHTVEFMYQPGSFLQVGEQRYELKQFHFHTPSEHTFSGGAHFPIEMHLVHKDPGGAIAVVGVMLVEGERNRALPSGRRLGQLLPREAGVIHEFDKFVELSALLPQNLGSYRYQGSLTTPPCSEQVSWLVLEQPVEVSAGQLRELRQALNQLQYSSDAGANNRPTQLLNGRRVFYHGGSR